ncbi:MAG: hypothetical protein V8R91_01675 [Butyricimonas faecihominis]
MRINLQWGSTDDLDLLVINPCSDTIYYKRKRQVCGGCTGTLDVDANAKPEMAIANLRKIYSLTNCLGRNSSGGADV